MEKSQFDKQISQNKIELPGHKEYKEYEIKMKKVKENLAKRSQRMDKFDAELKTRYLKLQEERLKY